MQKFYSGTKLQSG